MMQIKPEYIVHDKKTIANLLEVECLTKTLNGIIISLHNNKTKEHNYKLQHNSSSGITINACYYKFKMVSII